MIIYTKRVILFKDIMYRKAVINGNRYTCIEQYPFENDLSPPWNVSVFFLPNYMRCSTSWPAWKQGNTLINADYVILKLRQNLPNMLVV